MIEKLQRFCAMSDEHGRAVPASNGDYVLYSAARAREDALMDALNAVVEYENGIEDLLYSRKVIEQIKATR